MGWCWSLRPSTSCFPGCAASLPTASTTAPVCIRPLPGSVTGLSRSSNAPLTRLAFNCCHGDGSRHLGAARTGAYFSTAPFIGAAIAVPLLGEPVTWPLIAAAALMAGGVYLHLAEKHEREHMHEPLYHEHRHVHDTHHRH